MSSGPLLFSDLVAIWRSVTDPGYWRPLVEQPDSGVEVVEQLAEQLARVSLAIDRTTQALFIYPWSGQSDEPSGAGVLAAAVVQVTRSALLHRPLILDPGLVVLHVEVDSGEDGGVEVLTGRRYAVGARAWLPPGGMGPVDVLVQADRIGYGYNLPLEGTLRRILSVGRAMAADGATLIAGNRLVMPPGAGADVLAPAHAGQYIQFTAGPAEGQVRRILFYAGGSPVEVQLDAEWVLRGVAAGAFDVGEPVTQGAAVGRVLVSGGNWIVVEAVVGALVVGVPIVGGVTGATFTPDAVDVAGPLPTGVSSWRLLDWETDLGLVLTNPASPTGGRAATLDELGEERGVRRSSGETDDTYRRRVGEPADTISPNAIRRAGNRVLAPYGLTICLREVGQRPLPGFFYDAGSSADSPQVPYKNFAYDFDVVANPDKRFAVLLDLIHFRGFFLVGVPRFGFGDPGMPIGATGAGVLNAYGAAVPSGNFYGGAPYGSRRIHSALWAAIEQTRAGGVIAEMYVEDQGCP